MPSAFSESHQLWDFPGRFRSMCGVSYDPHCHPAKKGSAARPQRRLASGSLCRADLGVRRAQRMRRGRSGVSGGGCGPHLVNGSKHQLDVEYPELYIGYIWVNYIILYINYLITREPCSGTIKTILTGFLTLLRWRMPSIVATCWLQKLFTWMLHEKWFDHQSW